MPLPNRTKKYIAEAVGTFCLVFAGTGAVIVNRVSNGGVSSLGVSLVFGLIVLAMIYSIGHISGAHLNPAVSLAFYSLGRLSSKEVPFYIGAQLFGAILASSLLHFVFPAVSPLVPMTIPSGPWMQSFILEGVLSAILMFVIMGVAHDERAEGLMAGVAIGATITLEAALGGPISGASMNPARSLAPALLAGHFSLQWIYVVAPIGGTIVGGWIYERIRCDGQQGEMKGAGCC